MTALRERRRITVAEYRRMGEQGIFAPDERLELIDGEIYEMSPIGPSHAGCVKRLLALLVRRLGKTAVVGVQDPILLDDDTEPQPDVVVARQRSDYYSESHPRSDEILLLIEVADTTLEYDRTVKIPRYAQAGIIESWLVDLNRGVVVVYRDPSAGEYQSVQEFRGGQRIVPLAFPKTAIRVKEILG